MKLVTSFPTPARFFGRAVGLRLDGGGGYRPGYPKRSVQKIDVACRGDGIYFLSTPGRKINENLLLEKNLKKSDNLIVSKNRNI
jgi:hypothetical protein